jgi:hypothetical protein
MMMTHSKQEQSRESGSKQMNKKTVGLRSGRWLLPALAATLWLPGCGARANSGGNTGSETHWLQACDTDSDCGAYACYCGVCTRSCESAGQCDDESGPDAECAAPDALEDHAACGDVPAKICVTEDAVVHSTDGGGETNPTSGPVGTTDVGTTSVATDSSSTEVPTDAVICDGSDEVRLWTQTTNDFHPPQEGFRIAYGSKYLAIDGKCNFWAASPDGLFTGTITDQTVLADYEASYFGKLARFADYDPGPSIPDSDLAYVADTSGQVSINTSGAADPPEGYEETWAAINQLTDDLVQAGERSAGPLRLLMVVGEVISPEPWPLELDPKPWVAENFPGDEKRPDAGIWLNAGETANALRATGEGTYAYTGAAGTEYLQLFLRDEVPPKVLAALIGAQKTNSLNGAEIGATCDETEDCSNRLTCMTHSESGGGGSACNTCIAPGAKGADWECQSNDDCCGGLVCCVDCGDQSRILVRHASETRGLSFNPTSAASMPASPIARASRVSALAFAQTTTAVVAAVPKSAGRRVATGTTPTKTPCAAHRRSRLCPNPARSTPLMQVCPE